MANCWLTAAALRVIVWGVPVTASELPHGRTAYPRNSTPELVFREYAPRIYNLARRMLGNDADAEDVTQDVLLQVVRKLRHVPRRRPVATWLHRVTVNAALAHRQKRANRQKRETGDAVDDDLRTGRPGRAGASGGTSRPTSRSSRPSKPN